MAIPFQSGSPKNPGIPAGAGGDYSGLVDFGQGVQRLARGLAVRDEKKKNAKETEAFNALQSDWLDVKNELLHNPNVDLYAEGQKRFNQLRGKHKGLSDESWMMAERSLLFPFQNESTRIMVSRNERAKAELEQQTERTVYSEAAGEFIKWQSGYLEDNAPTEDPIQDIDNYIGDLVNKLTDKHTLSAEVAESIRGRLYNQFQQGTATAKYGVLRQRNVASLVAAGNSFVDQGNALVEQLPNAIYADDFRITSLVSGMSTYRSSLSSGPAYEAYTEKIQGVGRRLALNAATPEDAAEILDQFQVDDPMQREQIVDNRRAYQLDQYRQQVTAAVEANTLKLQTSIDDIYRDPLGAGQLQAEYFRQLSQLEQWAGVEGAKSLFPKAEEFREALQWLDYHKTHVQSTKGVSDASLDTLIRNVPDTLKYGSRIKAELTKLKDIPWSERIRRYVLPEMGELTKKQERRIIQSLGGTRANAAPEFRDKFEDGPNKGEYIWPDEYFHNLPPGKVLEERFDPEEIGYTVKQFSAADKNVTPQSVYNTLTSIWADHDGEASEFLLSLNQEAANRKDWLTAAHLRLASKFHPANEDAHNLWTNAIKGAIGGENKILADFSIKSRGEVQLKVQKHPAYGNLVERLNQENNVTEEEHDAILKGLTNASIRLMGMNTGQITPDDAVNMAMTMLTTNNAVTVNPSQYVPPFDGVPGSFYALSGIYAMRDERARFSPASSVTITQQDIDTLMQGTVPLSATGIGATLASKHEMAVNVAMEALYDFTDVPDTYGPKGAFTDFPKYAAQSLFPMLFGPTTELRRAMKEASPLNMPLSKTVLEGDYFFDVPGRGQMSSDDFHRMYNTDNTMDLVVETGEVDGERGFIFSIPAKVFNPEEPTLFGNPSGNTGKNVPMYERVETPDGPRYRRAILTFKAIGEARKKRDQKLYNPEAEPIRLSAENPAPFDRIFE